MVTLSTKRSDTAVRISRWLDEAVESYLTDRKIDPAAILDEVRKYSNSIGAQFAKLFDNFFSFIQ